MLCQGPSWLTLWKCEDLENVSQGKFFLNCLSIFCVHWMTKSASSSWFALRVIQKLCSQNLFMITLRIRLEINSKGHTTSFFTCEGLLCCHRFNCICTWLKHCTLAEVSPEILKLNRSCSSVIHVTIELVWKNSCHDSAVPSLGFWGLLEGSFLYVKLERLSKSSTSIKHTPISNPQVCSLLQRTNTFKFYSRVKQLHSYLTEFPHQEKHARAICHRTS